MKITTQHQNNLQSFYDFAKLSTTQKCDLLSGQGMILDQDIEKETSTNLYFLNGFFVEEIICSTTKEIQFIIPYKRGHIVGAYLEKKMQPFVIEKRGEMTWCVN